MGRNQTNGMCTTIGENALGKCHINAKNIYIYCQSFFTLFHKNHVHETCNMFVHILERIHSNVTYVTYYCIYNYISPMHYSVNFGFELLL